MVHLEKQLQTAASDQERVALLERELALARAQLASETSARRALEDQLNSVRAIVEPNKQGQSTAHTHEHVRREAPSAFVQLLEIAATYRQTNLKALSLARSQNNSEAEEAPGTPAELDLSDPARAIETLRSFDHADFLETIAKTGSTIRKWQKHCKGYREQAKSKIAYRNFVVGDLALFLPTRNSSLRPWAAFNGTARTRTGVLLLLMLVVVSFPHYFLQVPEDLSKQLQTREWLVARITSILQRVVDKNVRTRLC